MSLVSTLKADAARQLEFAGAPDSTVGTLQLLTMLPSPRFVPVVLYRLAYWCGKHRARPLGKALSMLNFVAFGLEIGVDCEIGPGLYFPHTSGTVLGARRIGARAVIYHNVTIGAKDPDLSYTADRRPEIKDNVFIGSGAKVLGGITVGENAVIAANAVVVHSVPDDALVGGIPARVLRHGNATAEAR